jgi:pyruvate dehydrogenase E1 component alpha subunit
LTGLYNSSRALLSDSAERINAEGAIVPRTPITVENKVEWLRILDQDGKVDPDLEPDIPEADLRKLYSFMLKTRRLDERCLRMQRQGRIGTYGPIKGQEATPLGFAYAMKPEDWLVPSYRELAAYLWRGWPVGKYMVWWGGHEYGSAVPEGINDLPICVPIASQCQYAMGIAWGCKLRKDNTVCVCFVGDGGTSQGDFHEALNYASVYQVPLVIVIQNNHWAISVPRRKQSHSPTLAQKALAYGMDALQIDGNDILAVVSAAREAIDKARSGGGPVLIEAITYRLLMHTTADDPRKYREEDEVKRWEARDPLIRFRTYLCDKGLLDEKIEQVIEEEIKKELDEGVEFYETFDFDKYEFFEHMYAEPTPELQQQRAALKKHLEAEQDESAPEERPEVSHA